ncbi:MAG: PAS domain-containing sensor histidine kinase [Chloroflexota bacterium]|nr:PAS domain-containing sensor histidine kinase [Chloroflexota bacterium]
MTTSPDLHAPTVPMSLWVAAVSASPVALALLSIPELTVLDATPGLTGLIGIDRGKLAGQRWQSLPIWMEEDAFPNHGEMGPEPFLVQFRVHGTSLIRDASCVATEVSDGIDQALVLTMTDITDTLGTERALIWQYEQLERARFEAGTILDTSDEAIVLVSPEGRITVANRAFLDLVRMPASDILGVPLGQLRGSLLSVLHGADLGDYLDCGPDQPCLTEELVFTPEPGARALHVTSRDIIGKDGFRYGRLFALTDVTRQREADRLKDDFVANISHELRTPLTSIAGFVDLLLEEDERDPALARRYLGVVRRNVSGLIEHVNQLLDFSRLQSGEIRIEPVCCRVEDVIERAATLLGPELGKRRQSIRIELPGDLPAVLADPERTFQVLVNLLSNATRFTAEGGAIRIVAEAIDGFVRTSVADNGIGLTETEQRLIFSRFYRVQTSGARSAPGTGLGLPIARQLVQRMGGEIDVQSVPGVGSVFSFTLPVARSA